MDSNTLIAIDGYASTGKSTLAKMLSRHYKLTFIDSGSLYRGVTFYALEKGLFENDQLNHGSLNMELHRLRLRFDHDNGDLYLNGENVSKKIRLPDVSDHVSTVAALTKVREFILKQIRQMPNKNGMVIDGRDIGTVVFPDADYKFFFTARPEVRARRRFEELKAQGQQTTFEEVLENLIHRDKFDTSRAISPLRKAVDAFEIDTSEMNSDKVFALLVEKIDSKLNP